MFLKQNKASQTPLKAGLTSPHVIFILYTLIAKPLPFQKSNYYFCLSGLTRIRNQPFHVNV